jgi:hypothetical protein
VTWRRSPMTVLSPKPTRARITDEKIAKFVETMRSNVLTGDTPFRRAYIRSVIDQVEVDDDEIRIWGRKSVLERLVAAGGGSPTGVPSFVRKWRPTGFEPGLCLRRWRSTFCPGTGSSSSIETRASSDGQSGSYSRPQPQRR